MNIIIAGGGIVGKNLVRNLSKLHNVVVIDKSKTNCEEIYARYSAIAIYGDAKDINCLKDAGIEKADVVLAVAGSDSENLIIALLGKSFGVKQIFVRMLNPDYEEAYQMAGATNLANSVSMIVNKFTMDIEKPEIRRLASFSGGKADISIIELPIDSMHIGKNIATIGKDLKFPEDCIIAGIFDSSEDKLIIPRGHCTVEAGNQLFLVGSKESVEAAYQYFSQKK